MSTQNRRVIVDLFPLTRSICLTFQRVSLLLDYVNWLVICYAIFARLLHSLNNLVLLYIFVTIRASQFSRFAVGGRDKMHRFLRCFGFTMMSKCWHLGIFLLL